MMRWSWRDSLATLLIVAAVVPYIGFLVRGEVPFVEDVRSMAAAGIILGLLAFVSGANPRTYGTGSYLPALAGAGVVALALGLATYSTEDAGLLAAFMCWLVAMWLITTIHHVRGDNAGRAQSRAWRVRRKQPHC